jgi:hypothetical protein
MANNPIYVKLTEEHFRLLVSGKEAVVSSLRGQGEVRIILSDIGGGRMQKALDDAEGGPQ